MVPPLPPEIIDRVVDFAHSNNPLLRALSLTSRAFLPSSRFHRFSRISIRPGASSSRLHILFIENPSLVGFVKELELLVVPHMAAETTPWVPLLRPLASSLRKVAISPAVQFELGARWNHIHKEVDKELVVLFQRENVESITINLGGPIIVTQGSGHGEGIIKPKLSFLELPLLCWPFIDATSAPVDVSHLKRLHAIEGHSEGNDNVTSMQSILAGCATSLEELVYRPSARAEEMPGLIALTTLSQCVYLRSFTLRLSSSSPSLLAHLLKAGQLPSSITHLKVILEVDAFHMHGDDVQKWNYVDQQACIFAVRTHYRKEMWATMLRGQIPLLQARGVVQIDDLDRNVVTPGNKEFFSLLREEEWAV
ncbi:hypothetical protein DL96DRAFT_1709452 [Flagelloscypha sp. PMI_526]|nr:hypothetical protein DL96DRAFT_1709452 [Flagelloscypha sp. PMI_526]